MGLLVGIQSKFINLKSNVLLILFFSGLLNNFLGRVRYFVPSIPEKENPS